MLWNEALVEGDNCTGGQGWGAEISAEIYLNDRICRG